MYRFLFKADAGNTELKKKLEESNIQFKKHEDKIKTLLEQIEQLKQSSGTVTSPAEYDDPASTDKDDNALKQVRRILVHHKP